MKRVLLIDDEQVLNETLCDVIHALGYTVQSYLSIMDARQREDFTAVDLVVCDVGLPGESAFSFARWIKDNHHDLPFILLSAFSEAEVIREGMDAGADSYLVKPVKLDELRKVLDQARSGGRDSYD